MTNSFLVQHSMLKPAMHACIKGSCTNKRAGVLRKG